MLYPFVFEPIFKDRVWGGHNLNRIYGKNSPANVPIGESWEISDRPSDSSVIANGPLAGRDLHWLMENHAGELLGTAGAAHGNRFPILCKILDAREKLSLQVHPPADKAASMGGEPKTEMWFIADAEPGAELYVGLKRGVTRGDFEEKIKRGDVEKCFHRVPVRAGDAMFLPSGRVHAIGSGLVIFEIQQNSDTTYRVFDWNRVGLDGKPRALHIAESLASIDFNDFEPSLVSTPFVGTGPVQKRQLVNDRLFSVEVCKAAGGNSDQLKTKQLQLIAVLTGELEVASGSLRLSLNAGQFCLVPACLEETQVIAQNDASYLRVKAE